MTKLYNAMLIGYIGVALYVVTEPWHDDIGGIVNEAIFNARNVWERGQFYLEAKVDTIILTKGM
jgi:hypothetical protein